MSTIEAYAFKRDLFTKRVKKDPNFNLKRAGVYVLIGPDDDAGKKIGYIGESENIEDRLVRHNLDGKMQERWLDTIVFMNKDANFTKAHARYVEAELIKIAKNNPAWCQSNKTNPSSDGILPIADRFAMDEFVKQVCTLSGTLGCDLFGIYDRKKDENDPDIQLDKAEDTLFVLKGSGYDAKAIFSGKSGKIIVKKESLAKSDTTNSIPPGNKKIRDDLISDEILVKTEDGYKFTRDYPFLSPSSAGGVVCGASVNGRTCWKTESGMTYADFFTEKDVQEVSIE
ncbi:MAG: GIY-YIG nuclease family protein [Magnetococcus sp. THC-1_WYH]